MAVYVHMSPSHMGDTSETSQIPSEILFTTPLQACPWHNDTISLSHFFYFHIKCLGELLHNPHLAAVKLDTVSLIYPNHWFCTGKKKKCLCGSFQTPVMRTSHWFTFQGQSQSWMALYFHGQVGGFGKAGMKVHLRWAQLFCIKVGEEFAVWGVI